MHRLRLIIIALSLSILSPWALGADVPTGYTPHESQSVTLPALERGSDVASIDYTQKVYWPTRQKASAAGPPTYYQYWLEEGINCRQRDLNIPGTVWELAVDDYFDYYFPIPGGGFAMPAGDFVVAFGYNCPAADDNLVTVTVSFRADGGAHIDTAPVFTLPSTAGAWALVGIPITTTAYTATSNAQFNVKVTAIDPAYAGPVYIDPAYGTFVGGVEIEGHVGVADGEDALAGWERPPTSAAILNPPASTHAAPVLLAGSPEILVRTEGIYPYDTVGLKVYSDTNRAVTHAATNERTQTQAGGCLEQVYSVTKLTGPVNSVVAYLAFDADYGYTTIPPPDACRDISDGGATTWAASTAYDEDDWIVPTESNEHAYQCTTAGTTGTTEPAWITDGTTVSDGTAVWTDMGERWEYDVNTYYELTIGARTLGIETLLDRNSPLSVSTSVDAPTLSAEANATTKDAVTLAWTDPATWTEQQPLGYEIKVTRPDGSVSQKVVGTRNDYDLGYLPVGTYSWTVRSIDPWGSVSDWASADSFDISLSGTAPTCILEPLPTTIWSQPVTRWTWYDPDGDVQTDYEVELYSDSTYTTNVLDTGTVTSTDLYYTHSGLANGTYYRQVRVRTASTDWSDWAQDHFTIADATTQSDDMLLYRLHPDGTKSRIYVPISDVRALRRLDGPGEFSFVFAAFEPFVEKDLLMCHHFDEVSGTVAHDIAGGYDLTLTGAPAWTDGVLNLTGTEYGDSADVDVALTDDFTAYLVGKFTGSSGTLWFLGADDDDLNYYTLEYNGAGKVRAAVYPTWARTNLVTNPKPVHEAASLPSGWSANGSVVTWSDGSVYDGITSKHVKIENGPGYAYVRPKSGSSGDVVVPGATYTFSQVMGEGVMTGCTLRLYVSWYDSGGSNVGTGTTKVITPGADFEQVSLSVVAPAGAAQVQFLTQAVGDLGAGDSFEFSICQVQIEKASAASLWFDGDEPGCSWSGTEDASTSTRPATTADLDVSVGAYSVLSLTLSDNTLTLTNLSTEESASLTVPSPTGDPALAIGHYAGATPGSIANSAELAGHLFYTRAMS